MFFLVVQFSAVYWLSADNPRTQLTYSIFQSDDVFNEFFIVDGADGTVYLSKSLAGHNVTSASCVIKVDCFVSRLSV